MSYGTIDMGRLKAAREKAASEPMMVEVLLGYWDFHTTRENAECLRYAQNQLAKFPHSFGVRLDLRHYEELPGVKVSELVATFPESCDRARAAVESLDTLIWQNKDKWSLK